MNEQEAGILLRDNWNRMARITHLRARNADIPPELSAEFSFRRQLQNAFACSRSEDFRNEVLYKIECLNAQTLLRPRKKREAVVHA